MTGLGCFVRVRLITIGGKNRETVSSGHTPLRLLAFSHR
jgi:hypothetical protein